MLQGDIERPWGRAHYRMSGRNHAPALVLLHPLGVNLEVWDAQRAEFERFFRLVCIDFRGHGGSTLKVESPGSSIDCTLADLADDVLAVLAALQVERAHFCGLSLGGAVALHIAALQSKRVYKLALANTAARFGEPAMWDERIASLRSQGLQPLADAAIERWFTAAFREQSATEVSKVRELWKRTTSAGYQAACAALRDADLSPSLASVMAPTLVIAGAADATTPIAAAETLQSGITGADLVIVDAAHLSNVEQAEEFTRLVCDFLRD